MQVDSLVVSLGLDPNAFRAGLVQIQAALNQLNTALGQFTAGFQQGLDDALSGAGNATKQGVEEVSGVSETMVNRFEEAVNRFSEGVDKLGHKTEQAKAKAKAAGSEFQKLGRQWGSFLGGIAARFAAPLAGAVGAGAMLGSYFNGVAQVAQMYGRWNTQMEEWRKKRELLSRVSREDIELYRKGKLALLDFQFAMAGLSTTVMRALSPAIRKGIELLHGVSDWVRANEVNIIRFMAVLAGTITAVLLPALIKMGVALLMNPITWIIAGIILLALVIDDLVTYIRGGETALGGLWAQFGTGEEILEKLKILLERFGPLLKIGAVWAGGFIAAFSGFSVVTKLLGAVRAAILAVNVAMMANPIGLIVALIAGAVALIIFYWDDIKAAIIGAWEYVSEKTKAIWGELVGWIEEKVNWFLDKWENIKNVISIVGGSEEEKTARRSVGQGRNGGGMIPTPEELTRAAVSPSATTNNQSREVNYDMNINQNISVPGGDAEEIQRASRGAAQSAWNMGVYASDGGTS